MKRLAIVLLLSIVGCANLPNHEKVETYVPIDFIDPILDPILKDFEYEAGLRGFLIDKSVLSMSFANVREKNDKRIVMGYCQVFSNRQVIKMHGPAWPFLDPYQQEVLVFHELAHCVLGRTIHCDTENADGPISIVNTYVLNGEYYKAHREELIDELFSPSNQCVNLGDCVDEIYGKVCLPKNNRSEQQRSLHPGHEGMH